MQGRIHELAELHPGQLLQLVSFEHPTDRHPRAGGGLSPLQEAVMLINLSLSPGYRLKITRASRMSELADRVITALAAVGGSAAFLDILRRWLERRQGKRQEELQLDVLTRINEDLARRLEGTSRP